VPRRVTFIAWGLQGGGAGGAPRLLQRALARALPAGPAPAGAEAALLAELSAAEPAAAALAAASLAADWPAAAGQPCLGADPVHLQADLRDVQMVTPLALDLRAAEADALIGQLNAHFEPENLSFVRGDGAHRWYVLAGGGTDLRALPARRAPIMPRRRTPVAGADAGRWRRVAAEAEMLLHASPVNEARQARGALPVNGLWFWGGGEPSPAPRAPLPALLLGDDPLAAGLAQRFAVPAAGLEALPPRWPCGHTVIYEHALRDALLAGDAEGWQRACERFVARRLAPALRALLRGRVRALRLVCEAGALELRFADWLAFWRRRPPPATAHAGLQ